MPATDPQFKDYARAYELIHSILQGILAPPKGQKITKLGFWEDSNGDMKYIKAYNGAAELFVLEFDNAGAAAAETWSITRTDS